MTYQRIDMKLVVDKSRADGYIFRCGNRRFAKQKTICGNVAQYRSGTFFEKSKISIFKIVAFVNMWLGGVPLTFITNQLDIATYTSVDWASFCREVAIAVEQGLAMNKLYPHHIPTTPLQKILLSVGSAAAAITSPRRGDMVATFGETSGGIALPSIKSRMESDEVGRKILQDQPRISNKTIDRKYLSSLPARSLGKQYSNFLDNLDTSPDERPPVRFIDDLSLLYVMQRYRETHDFFHVLLEMPTNILGEVAVKWFEGIQFGLPMSVTGGLFGAARLRPKQRAMYVETLLPWITRNARNGQFLMNVYWEKHWEDSIDDLQLNFGFEKPPVFD